MITPTCGLSTARVYRRPDATRADAIEAIRLTGDLYVSTDFSVLRLEDGGNVWVEAAAGLPPVATYGLTIDTSDAGRVLYAATHGRGTWSVALP